MIEWRDYIERRDGVMIGKPVFKGTGITPQRMLELTSGGRDWDEIVAEYPEMTREHLEAAHLFAAEVLSKIRSDAVMPPAEPPVYPWDLDESDENEDNDGDARSVTVVEEPAVAG